MSSVHLCYDKNLFLVITWTGFPFGVHGFALIPVILESGHRKQLFVLCSCSQTTRSVSSSPVQFPVALSAAKRATVSVLGRVAVQWRRDRVGVRPIQNESAHTELLDVTRLQYEEVRAAQNALWRFLGVEFLALSLHRQTIEDRVVRTR